MSIIRWKPLKELDTLRHQMNRLFDDLLHGKDEFDRLAEFENVMWSPAIELKESDHELTLKALVPGIDAKDLEVQVSENVVSLGGEHREEKRTERKGYFRSELQYGQFQRQIPLPVPVKHKEVQAEFKDGVLTLVMPKAELTNQNVTKVDLTAKARESVVQQRQHEELRQEAVSSRAAAEMETPSDAGIQEEARERIAEDRQQDENRQGRVHVRAIDNLNSSAS